MKKNLAYFTGNDWWRFHGGDILNEYKNGKFFSGLRPKYLDQKTNRYRFTGFRLCKKKLK